MSIVTCGSPHSFNIQLVATGLGGAQRWQTSASEKCHKGGEMRISSKCSVAIHSLVLIVLWASKYRVTSALLAKSTGCNAVVIRNIMIALKKAGIISVSKGSRGIQLLLDPKAISLWQVYCALETDPAIALFGLHPKPSPVCPVGYVIHDLLSEPYKQIGAAMEQMMRSLCLQDILDRFHSIKPPHYYLSSPPASMNGVKPSGHITSRPPRRPARTE
jgi:DNA-binding IscR family transcriptional regulator